VGLHGRLFRSTAGGGELMAQRKLSPKDYKALNRGSVAVRYPPGGGAAEVRAFDQGRLRRKEPDEGDKG
jgi:hypothetical protein